MRTIENLVDIPAAGFPAWDPTANRIAYLHDQPGAGWELRLVDVESRTSRRLSERSVAPWRPAWAPDGSCIAVVLGNARGGSDIWLVPIDAGEERLLVSGGSETRAVLLAGRLAAGLHLRR